MLYSSSAVFLVLIFLAMVFYTGGTRDNHAVPGYSFWGNTLSDSGRLIAWSGAPNTVSMIIFSLSLIIYGIFYIPFYLLVAETLTEGKLEKLSSKMGKYFGITFSVCIIGIAFSPGDILYILHIIFVFIGYPSTFLNGVFFSIAFYKNKRFSNIYALIFAIYTVFFFISIGLAFIGLLIDFNLTVLGQKLASFASLVAFFIIGYGFWKFKRS